MAPISDAARNSLDNLNNRIEDAEKVLLRMPASRLEKCVVDVTDEMRLQANSNKYCLLQISTAIDEVGEEYEGFMVCTYTDDSLEEVEDQESIYDLPISKRIAVAKCIPKLFSIADALEGQLPALADEAANEIEQMLASRSAK